MPLAAPEHTISAIKRLQTDALDHVATGVGSEGTEKNFISTSLLSSIISRRIRKIS